LPYAAKTNLKTPKGQSESANRRSTDNTMTIFKDEKTHNGQQKSAQKTKD